MTENIQQQNINQQPGQPGDIQQSKQQPVIQEQKQKKKDEEFSLKWHLKILAVIYILLGILYIILRIYLK